MMVPLMVARGYDRMVTVAVVTVAQFVGALASTINPFMTGIGSSKAGVTIAGGMTPRLLLFAVTMAGTVGCTAWYARRVKADPSKSLCGISSEDAAIAGAGAPGPLTRRMRSLSASGSSLSDCTPSRSFPGARSWRPPQSTLTRTRRSIRRSGKHPDLLAKLRGEANGRFDAGMRRDGQFGLNRFADCLRSSLALPARAGRSCGEKIRSVVAKGDRGYGRRQIRFVFAGFDGPAGQVELGPRSSKKCPQRRSP
jgi:hypothetical protein